LRERAGAGFRVSGFRMTGVHGSFLLLNPEP
jgi:hypothetical protein